MSYAKLAIGGAKMAGKVVKIVLPKIEKAFGNSVDDAVKVVSKTATKTTPKAKSMTGFESAWTQVFKPNQRKMLQSVLSRFEHQRLPERINIETLSLLSPKMIKEVAHPSVTGVSVRALSDGRTVLDTTREGAGFFRQIFKDDVMLNCSQIKGGQLKTLVAK